MKLKAIITVFVAYGDWYKITLVFSLEELGSLIWMTSGSNLFQSTIVAVVSITLYNSLLIGISIDNSCVCKSRNCTRVDKVD